MLNKLLFLDIDGVLNFASFRNRVGMDAVDKDCVQALCHIIEQTGCKIIISSTWRVAFFSHEQFKDSFRGVLKRSGVKQDVADKVLDAIIGMTLDFNDCNRGAEIQEWLDSNEFVGKHAILDDVPEIIGTNDNFFACNDDSVGLTWEIADRVIAHLTKD